MGIEHKAVHELWTSTDNGGSRKLHHGRVHRRALGEWPAMLQSSGRVLGRERRRYITNFEQHLHYEYVDHNGCTVQNFYNEGGNDWAPNGSHTRRILEGIEDNIRN